MIPAPVLRPAGHEMRVLAGLVRWPTGRRHGVGPDDRASPARTSSLRGSCVRYGALFDLRVPLHLVTAVRAERRIHDGGLIRLDGERLEVVVSAMTTVVVEPAEPVTVTRPLGRTGTASLIRLHTDEPRELVRELSARVTRRDAGQVSGSVP
ncbi:hypothetical protein [Streptosporangium sp. NPDC051022]|uniref:hypothetical protein n=1 Tax=Streptosporangium sp. NPDC051022 TaxID=3155752 RepID=UPI00342F0F93